MAKRFHIGLYGKCKKCDEMYMCRIRRLEELGVHGGSVVECRTPEQEVGGSKPTAAVLCP